MNLKAKITFMYKEFEKYKTGEKIKGVGVLPDKQEVDIYYDEYSAPLGDLMYDFIKHVKKPWWKKKLYNHEHITEIYVNWLNKITMTETF